MFSALEKEQLIGGHLRVRRWRHRGSELLSAPESVHSAVELCWIDQGFARYQLGHRTLEVRAGQTMVVPAGVDHATAFSAGTVAGSLWLSSQQFEALADAVGTRVELTAGTLPGPTSTELITLAQLLSQEAFGGHAGSLLAADALAEALSLKLMRVAPKTTSGPRSPGIRRALEAIHLHYAEDLTVDSLAHVAAMSRFHFSRRFQEQLCMSPYAYLLTHRVHRAAELLRSGKSSVTEAALSCGLPDLGRLGRRFRALYGCTPSEYAQASRRKRSSVGAPHADVAR